MLIDAPDPPLEAPLQISKAAMNHRYGKGWNMARATSDLQFLQQPSRLGGPAGQPVDSAQLSQGHRMATGEFVRLLGRRNGLLEPPVQRVGDRKVPIREPPGRVQIDRMLQLRDRWLELPRLVKEIPHICVVEWIERIQLQHLPQLGQGLFHPPEWIEE